jgi:DNA polymerase III subunit delta'
MTPDEAFEHIRHAFEANRLAQGYVIAGPPRGEGAALAERILQLLCCEGSPRPCGQCRPCRQTAAHASADGLWIEPQKRSRIISVDQVRDLQRQVYQTSYSAGWKACVLIGADRFSGEAANAFLKVLEEPPGKCLFLLLSDSPQALLPTVISRCQRLTLTGGESVVEPEWRQDLLDALIQASAGSRYPSLVALAAAERLESLMKKMKDRAEDEEKALLPEGLDAEEKEDLLGARVSARYREMRSRLMRSLLLWYRDVLLVVCGADEALLHHREHIGALREQGGRLTYRQARRNVEIVSDMYRQLEMNLKEGPVLGFGFARMLH